MQGPRRGCRQRPRPRLGDREARTRMQESGLRLHAGGGEGGDPGSGTTEEGRTVETRGRDPRRGASLEAGGAGADLTACEEARRGRPG